jgi:ribosomal protein S12 methylthiotransferase
MGCAKNIVDSEVLLGQLKHGSAHLVKDIDEADIAVINTCGFIEAAKQESIDAILEALERKKRGELKKVVVLGCLAERYRNELLEEMPELEVVFGSNQLHDVTRVLGVDYKRELLGERHRTTPRHFAYLKISEGCDHPCSFCAIPLMRGKHRTKPTEQVLKEAEHLAGQGVKELIVIAQDSTFYGMDLYGERRLGSLLAALSNVEGIEWIRLMYAYPTRFPLDVLEAFRQSTKICRYIDLPLQHASDRVLKSMRRGVTNRVLRDLIGTMKDVVPDLAIRTTFIVGYPNETEADFQMLLDFIRDMEFHRVGVFTYSQEDGTNAFALGDPVSPEVKEQRRAMVMELQQEISERRNQSLIGSTQKVLTDRLENGYAVGRTEWDAPEIDEEVYISGDGLEAGRFYDVIITDAVEYDLYGRTLS